MGTQEKLKHIKEIVATAFLNATTQSAASGLQYGYKSYGVEEENFKGWCIDILVKEAGYGERTIQTLRYHRPDNIDAKNMEYHVLVQLIVEMTSSSCLTWYEVAKMLASDIQLQTAIIHGKEDNQSSN
jgi:hypothetical protein